MNMNDDVKLCECHGEPMMRYQNVRSGPKAASHYWRCRVKYNEWQKNNRKAKPEMYSAQARRMRLKKFGMTEADYESLLEAQGGTCAICDGPPDTRWKKLAVDHDHDTNEVRGLLCMTCNTMLGRLEARFDRTMEYLGASL